MGWAFQATPLHLSFCGEAFCRHLPVLISLWIGPCGTLSSFIITGAHHGFSPFHLTSFGSGPSGTLSFLSYFLDRAPWAPPLSFYDNSRSDSLGTLPFLQHVHWIRHGGTSLFLLYFFGSGMMASFLSFYFVAGRAWRHLLSILICFLSRAWQHLPIPFIFCGHLLSPSVIEPLQLLLNISPKEDTHDKLKV